MQGPRSDVSKGQLIRSSLKPGPPPLHASLPLTAAWGSHSISLNILSDSASLVPNLLDSDLGQVFPSSLLV